MNTKSITALLAALALAAISTASAATVTLEISGTVPVTTTASTTAASATLSTANFADGVTDLSLATINEKCNKKAGYTVTLLSAGADANDTTSGRLVGSGTATGETITYTIKYGGSAVNFAAGAAATVTNANDKTGASGVDKGIAISFSGGFYAAGAYSDTLTLTIAEK